jgi:uncharacterized Fe-S cluster-containing protein
MLMELIFIFVFEKKRIERNDLSCKFFAGCLKTSWYNCLANFSGVLLTLIVFRRKDFFANKKFVFSPKIGYAVL